MVLNQREKIEIRQFLELASGLPVIDVRSPAEFMSGHIPGAYNIPLFDDAGREAVGIKYRREGRIPAVLEGLALTGPSMHKKLETALKISAGKKLLVHCWRGGMRSEAMAWLFKIGGMETYLLEGGYKSYRRHVLESLAENRKMIILGGLTGSGKTEILKYIHQTGRQVADLEALANHRGSAFGSTGELPQPSSEHFSNLLFETLRKTDRYQTLWVEDESRNIGSVFMPEEFYLNMQMNPAIILIMDAEIRIPRLVREYSSMPSAILEASVMKISRRMGGDKAKDAVAAINDRDLAGAVRIVLAYYDKAYLYSLNRRNPENLLYIRTETDDIETNALKILEASDSINRQ
jgi:tRNA 2-selenouridine synthase